MKIEKAIEIIGSNGLCDAEVTWGDYLKAVQLGRKALKRIKACRKPEGYKGLPGLQGETED